MWAALPGWQCSPPRCTATTVAILWRPTISGIWRAWAFIMILSKTTSPAAPTACCGADRQLRYPQTKLVRVVSGTVFDVAVDLRPGSDTYLRWHGEVLSAENKKQFLIPAGFAHGFLVLSQRAEFCYKVTDFFHPDDEGGIPWDDPKIGVEWPIPPGMTLQLSEKDKHWEYLK